MPAPTALKTTAEAPLQEAEDTLQTQGQQMVKALSFHYPCP